MSGLGATIYLRQDGDEILDDVHRFLRAHTAEMRTTRKGRVWDVVITAAEPPNRIYTHIQVHALRDRLPEHEDTLRELGLSVDQVASCSSFSTGLKYPHLRTALQGLINGLAMELQALASRGPE